MTAVGIISSIMLLAGGILILFGSAGSDARDRQITAIMMIAMATFLVLIAVAGDLGRPAAALGLVVGVAAMVYGARAVTVKRIVARDVPETTPKFRSPLHDDPVVERLGRATNAALWDWELPEDTVNFSSNIIAMLGYDELSLCTERQWWSERVHPEDRERTVETLLEAVRTAAASWQAEYRFQRGDGSYAHILDRGFVITDDAGTPVRMVGAMDDMTARRIAEQAAREHEAQFETLAENATDFIARLDRDLRHVYVNRALVDAFAMPKEQILGRTNRDLGIQRNLSDKLDAAVRGVIKTGEQTTIEFDYETKQGNRHLMARLTPEFNEDGRVETVLSIVRDISELKETSNQLAREKAFIDTAMNSLPGIFYLIDRDGRFQRWNDNFERISQYSGDEIAALHPTDLFHDEDKAMLRERIAMVFEAGESWVEADFVAKDGSHTPFYFTGQRVVLEGEPYLVGMGVDISKQKEAEKALRESERRYRLFFESSPQPMWVFDRETLRFLSVNNAAIAKYGYSADEFLAMTIKEIRPKEDVPRLIESLARQLQGVDHSGIWRHTLKDGTLIDVEIVSHVLEFAGRKAELVLANDVTERLKAERELRHSEERFANFMDRSPTTAWIKDEQGRYVYVNRTHCEEYQVLFEQVVGRTDFELFREDIAEELAANDRAALARDESIETTETINNPDGTDHIWLVVKFPMNNPEGGRMIGGLALDITEQKQAEKALREYADALKRSNEELEQFAYVASHDLQEPLRMVASYTQLLGERYQDKLDADADEFIHYAVEGAQRMQRLIEDLLLYSRVESQGGRMSEIEVDAAIDEASGNLKSAIHASGATIDRGPMPTVQADHSQLVQLFQNLLSNAIKFRGELSPRISIRVEQDKNEWIFSVSDNGIGIEPTYHDRIFVIFQRLHGRAEYTGTGIGLAVCKRIVERHGGRIWVESSLGNGATFCFTLPAGKETA